MVGKLKQGGKPLACLALIRNNRVKKKEKKSQTNLNQCVLESEFL